MPYYRTAGQVPPKRHTQHRRDDGELLYEELIGEEGFSSNSSLLYHRDVPAAIVASCDWPMGEAATVPNHPLRPRHLRPHRLFDGEDPAQTDVVTGRRLLLANDDVRVLYVVAGTSSPLYRDATGDECVYVEAGEGRLDSVMGPLDVGPGDYVVVPRGVTHRWTPIGEDPLRCLVVEAGGHISPPARYLSRYGQFLEQSPYCERDLRSPTGPVPEQGSDVEVHVRHRGSRRASLVGSVLTHARHPFDVVGWDGCLYPYALSIHDFEPLTGRIHQPPPVHQVFEGDGFVMCNFVPRKVDYHERAIPVPYYHANVDSDEVLFYCGGDYEARKGSGIGSGSISLHPNGHTHGPQPGAMERSLGVEFFDELAVMVDTFRPLELGADAVACEDPDYAWSWAARR